MTQDRDYMERVFSSLRRTKQAILIRLEEKFPALPRMPLDSEDLELLLTYQSIKRRQL